MNKAEAKKWAELFTALAEGKIVERQMISFDTHSLCWVQVDSITTMEDLKNYRIKPTPKTRRMTDQELADWLRDEPQEHREFKWEGGSEVLNNYDYPETEANKPCGFILIRRNHGEWEEPIVEE